MKIFFRPLPLETFEERNRHFQLNNYSDGSLGSLGIPKMAPYTSVTEVLKQQEKENDYIDGTCEEITETKKLEKIK